MFRSIAKNTFRSNNRILSVNSLPVLFEKVAINNNTPTITTSITATTDSSITNVRYLATTPTKKRDPTYKHVGKHLKNRLYNYGMKQGKKETMRKHLLKSMKEIQKVSTKNHVDLMKLSIINNAPLLKIKSIKRNRSVREFPYVIKKENRIGESIKSIFKTTNNKSSPVVPPAGGSKIKNKHAFYNKLKDEILLSSSSNNTNSNAIKSKIEKQDDALKLKKFAHYRWLE